MDLVCVKSHSNPDSGIIKGRQFRLHSIKRCACGHLKFNVGIKVPQYSNGTQFKCGCMFLGKIWWFHPSLFQLMLPMQTELSEVSVDEIINEPQTV